MVLAERLAQMMDDQGISQAELARRVKVSQPSIGKLVNGLAQSSVHLHKIARELGTSVEYLTGETDNPDRSYLASPRESYRAPPAPTPRYPDDIVPVRQIDFSYGMGATFLDVPVNEEIRYFPHAFLRTYTKARPEELFWATGVGDSMFPDISDSDTLLIDTSQNHIGMADRIWAIAWGDVGMVKRLRPLPDGSVEIISSNPSVPSARAVDGEMTVIGRVVAVIRKI